MISIAMKEIRVIRDNNSKRHLVMTKEERKEEEKKLIKWFSDEMGNSTNITKNNSI